MFHLKGGSRLRERRNHKWPSHRSLLPLLLYCAAALFLFATLVSIVIFVRRKTATYFSPDSTSRNDDVSITKEILDALEKFDRCPESAKTNLAPLLAEERTVFSSDYVHRRQSPQYRAVQWIAEDRLFTKEHGMRGTADPSSANDGDVAVVAADSADQLLQRYSVAVLYFATNGNDWNECSHTAKLSPCESDARSSFRSVSVGGGKKVESSRFLSNSHVCFWHGVTCSNENAKSKWSITWIDLTGNGLVGTIPDELALLSSLELLWLPENPGLGGQIPSSIGALGSLQSLSLYQTGMVGPLPESLYGLEKLSSLRLYHSSFSGKLSPKIGKLRNLEWLWLHQNNFTGGVPVELGQLRKLESLTLHGNRFESIGVAAMELHDVIPEALCKLLREKGRNLQQLWVDCGKQNKCSCCTKCFQLEKFWDKKMIKIGQKT